MPLDTGSLVSFSSQTAFKASPTLPGRNRQWKAGEEEAGAFQQGVVLYANLSQVKVPFEEAQDVVKEG